MNLFINASPLQSPNWSGVQLYTFRILDHMSRLAPEMIFDVRLSRKLQRRLRRIPWLRNIVHRLRHGPNAHAAK